MCSYVRDALEFVRALPPCLGARGSQFLYVIFNTKSSLLVLERTSVIGGSFNELFDILFFRVSLEAVRDKFARRSTRHIFDGGIPLFDLVVDEVIFDLNMLRPPLKDVCWAYTPSDHSCVVFSQI